MEGVQVTLYICLTQDGNNNPAFKMESSALSLTEKRVLKNAKNQPVCSLKKKVSYSLPELLCS